MPITCPIKKYFPIKCMNKNDKDILNKFTNTANKLESETLNPNINIFQHFMILNNIP